MRRLCLAIVAIAFAGCLPGRPRGTAAQTAKASGAQAVPVDDPQLQGAAQRMIHAAENTLAPVYAPLAEQIVADLDLAAARGIGIDLGSGPGTLIVELCPRTRLHWVNADINPYFFPYFYRLAEARGVGHRVSAVYADATRMPFRDDYADVVVSRGSYHFWPDREAGFAEVYRVLKPGGVAYIGRGFSQNLPVETAQRIRTRQHRRGTHAPKAEAESLRKMLAGLGIRGVRIHLPAPPGADVNYGLWVEFHKPREPSP